MQNINSHLKSKNIETTESKSWITNKNPKTNQIIILNIKI